MKSVQIVFISHGHLVFQYRYLTVTTIYLIWKLEFEEIIFPIYQ